MIKHLNITNIYIYLTNNVETNNAWIPEKKENV